MITVALPDSEFHRAQGERLGEGGVFTRQRCPALEPVPHSLPTSQGSGYRRLALPHGVCFLCSSLGVLHPGRWVTASTSVQSGRRAAEERAKVYVRTRSSPVCCGAVSLVFRENCGSLRSKHIAASTPNKWYRLKFHSEGMVVIEAIHRTTKALPPSKLNI